MARFTLALASVVPFGFSLLGFIFSILAVRSPDWASQNQYSTTTDPASQFTPIYTLYRSPFQICTVIPVASNSTAANSTDSGGGDSPPPDPSTLNYTYISNCTHYAVTGLGKTSCELPTVLNSNVLPQVGDARQCQQIHLAGNYLVASAVFTGLTVVLTLTLICLSLAGGRAPGPHRHHDNHDGDGGAEEVPLPRAFGLARLLARQLMVPFVAVGAGAALLSQFYAVLGLIQSAPNNADFASSQGNRQYNGPWIQGTALSVYMSLSWFWALLAAWGVWVIWGASGGINGRGRYAGHEAVKRRHWGWKRDKGRRDQ